MSCAFRRARSARGGTEIVAVSAPISRRDLLLGRFRRRLVGSTGGFEGSAGEARSGTKSSRSRARARAEARRALRTQVPMVAQLDAGRCLGSYSQVCSVCVERCPEPDVIRLEGTLPVIDSAACTGCGECERRCPAPFAAIRVLPQGRLPT